MDALLASAAGSPVFTATRAPYLLLDETLTIQAANDAYLHATARDAEEIVGRFMFDAFPDNPADPTASGTRNLAASLNMVLRRNAAHAMPIQRYDVAPTGSAVFVPKTWSPTNSPIADARGRVAGVLHHVEDLSELTELLHSPPADGSAPTNSLVVAAARYRRDRNGAQQENSRLRDALSAMAASRGGVGAHPHAVARRRRLWRQVAVLAGDNYWVGWAGALCAVAVTPLLWCGVVFWGVGGVVGSDHRWGWGGGPALCAVAVAALDSVTGAALTLTTATAGRQLVAVSSTWARRVEELDHSLEEGPAHAAQLAGVPVHVSDLSREHTLWPAYSIAAADIGLRGVSAFPVALGGSNLGTFTVYRRHQNAVSESEWTDTALMADLAVAAVLADQERIEHHLLDGEAPGPRYDLSAAVGMVAVDLDLSFDDAVNRLRSYSRALNRAMSDIALDVLRGNLQIR